MAPWKQMWKKFTSNDSKSQKDNQFGAGIIRDRDPESTWETLTKLGDGAFAVVYKAQHKVEKSKQAALKLVEDIKSIEETEMMLVMLEIEILTKCKHEYVLGLEEAYLFQDKLYMYLELCDGGGLDSIMQELQKGLTEPQIRAVGRQTCLALQYLHRMFVVHRDIKAANILLTSSGTIRLADFGVSAMNNSIEQKRHTFIGTPYWTAPEVFECADFPQNEYDYKADIWSFGITLIELAEIEPPHHTTRPERLFPKVVKGPPPKLNSASGVIWHPDFHNLLTKCLQKDPHQRSTASDLLTHPFLANATEVKPLLELLAEFKADVIDEDVSSETGDHDERRFLQNQSSVDSINYLPTSPSIDDCSAPEKILIKFPSNDDEMVHPETSIEGSAEESSADENKSEEPLETIMERSQEQQEEEKAESGDSEDKDRGESDHLPASTPIDGDTKFNLGDLPSPVVAENEQVKQSANVESEHGDDSTGTAPVVDKEKSMEKSAEDAEKSSEGDKASDKHLVSGSGDTVRNQVETENSGGSPEKSERSNAAVSRADELRLSLSGEPVAATRKMKLKGGDEEEEKESNLDDKVSENEDRKERHKRYKSIRRTRKFMIDGQVFTSTQTKVVTMDGKKDLAFERLQKRKEAIRQVQRFQRKEKLLFEKAGADIESKQQEFENKMKGEELAETKRFEAEKDRIAKNFRSSLAKLEQQNDKDYQSERSKFGHERDQNLKKYKNRMKESTRNSVKIEESRLSRDVDSSDQRKESLKAFKMNLDKENIEKEKAYKDSLDQKFNERMKEMKLNQIEECFNLEMNFLNEKQSLIRKWNKTINDLREYSIQEKGQLLKQANRERFDLVRKLNLEKYDRELQDMTSVHEKEMDDLKTAHLNDNKALPKELEKENKFRLMMHRRQIEIMLEKNEISESDVKQLTVDFKKNDQKRKAVLMKKREQKQKDELEIMRERHENEIIELMSYQNEQKARLDQTEKAKEQQTEQEFKKDLEKFREERRALEKTLEDDFLREVKALKKNYAVTTEAVDQLKFGFESTGTAGSWSPSSSARRTFSTSSTKSNSSKAPVAVRMIVTTDSADVVEGDDGTFATDHDQKENSTEKSQGSDLN